MCNVYKQLGQTSICCFLGEADSPSVQEKTYKITLILVFCLLDWSCLTSSLYAIWLDAMAEVRASLESFECFECSICLESMLDKRPLVLSCLHTFCTPCITRLYERPPLTCPTCRTETAVPDGDVNKLPVNRDLIKIMEREKEINREQEPNKDPGNLCESCLRKGKRNKSGGFCVQCVRILCQECMEKHRLVPAFKDHQLVTKVGNKTCQDEMVCAAHGEVFQFVCMACLEPSCVDCIEEVEHAAHIDKVEKFESGIAHLRERRSQLSTTLSAQVKDLSGIKMKIKSDFDILDKTKKDLDRLLEFFERKAAEVKGFQQLVSENEKSMRQAETQIKQLIDQGMRHQNVLNTGEQLSDLKYLGHTKDNPVSSDWMKQTQEMSDRIQQYKVPRFDVNKSFANRDIFDSPVGTINQIPANKQVKMRPEVIPREEEVKNDAVKAAVQTVCNGAACSQTAEGRCSLCDRCFCRLCFNLHQQVEIFVKRRFGELLPL